MARRKIITPAAENPLARGFYTVPEAARLIEWGSPQRIYGWLRGYHGRSAGPMLVRDYRPIDDKQELSFIDLIEVRFIEHFRDHGVKMNALRLAANELRKELKTEHPFASSQVYLVADKADVFLGVMRESAEKTGDRALLSLTTKNYVMTQIIERDLVPGITFDKNDFMPRRWAPRHSRFPQIVIDPFIAYGQPAGPTGVPTGVIRDAWAAEGENMDEAAYWLNIPVSEVAQAVEFERLLDERAREKAA